MFACGAVLLAASTLGAPAPSPELVASLRKGISISGWWSEPPRGALLKTQAASLLTEEDARMMLAMGVRHIRVPLSLKAAATGSGNLYPFVVDLLKSQLAWFTKRKIAVVLDMDPTGLDSRAAEAGVKALVTGSMAIRETRLAYGLSAPAGAGAKAWRPLQTRLIRAIRSRTTAHTIVVSSSSDNGIDSLISQKPYEEKNLIYGFSFYDPYLLTHQGLASAKPPADLLSDLPYPVRAITYLPLVTTVPKDSRGPVERMAREGWNRTKIAARIRRAKMWGDLNHSLVYCREFGMHAPGCSRRSREEWLTDTRTSLDSLSVGWAMNGYVGGFGLASGPVGHRYPERGVVEALGLKFPKGNLARS